MKTILLHVQDDEWLDGRLQAALSLTRATEGHLSCLHVTPIEAYVAFDSFGGVFVMPELLTAIEQHETDLKARLEAQLGKEDVSWDYQQHTGATANMIVSHAALADVVVTGRDYHRETRALAPLGLLGDLLHRSRTPLLVPARDGPGLDPVGPMLVAWDGGYEAANAVRGAIGLLKLASTVEVVRVEEKPEGLFPSSRLLEYLSRHGVHAELRVETGRDEEVPATLLARASAIGATCMVMGGYGRSRVGEYLFGGVTRSLLKDAPIALLIAR